MRNDNVVLSFMCRPSSVICRLIGAWGRFRAHLSAASARRFHQISFPGERRTEDERQMTDERFLNDLSSVVRFLSSDWRKAEESNL
jgi:hypothetical protein